jgi:hypothetical protein
MPSNQAELRTLKNLLFQADHIYTIAELIA